MGCFTDTVLVDRMIVRAPVEESARHHDDVIMTTLASQITSLTVVYWTVYSDADQRKHQISASLAFVWGIHRDRWIPRTKGQLRGKCFHLMTSSWIWIKSPEAKQNKTQKSADHVHNCWDGLHTAHIHWKGNVCIYTCFEFSRKTPQVEKQKPITPHTMWHWESLWMAGVRGLCSVKVLAPVYFTVKIWRLQSLNSHMPYRGNKVYNNIIPKTLSHQHHPLMLAFTKQNWKRDTENDYTIVNKVLYNSDTADPKLLGYTQICEYW